MRRHLTYANVMATIGVFLALGGVSYAAIKLPRNSVGAKQIKAGAVGSSEVKNHALRVGDFKDGQLPRGPKGARGPQGDRGAPAAKYWAQIGGGTTRSVLNSSGGVDVDRNAANGMVSVTFPADVSKCASSLTVVSGVAGRTIRKLPSSSSGQTVAVWTTYIDGNDVATTTNDPFDIAVFC